MGFKFAELGFLLVEKNLRLLDAFKKIKYLYPVYFAGKTTNKNDPSHLLIFGEVPRLLKELSSGKSLLKFEGYADKGNLKFYDFFL